MYNYTVENSSPVTEIRSKLRAGGLIFEDAKKVGREVGIEPTDNNLPNVRSVKVKKSVDSVSLKKFESDLNASLRAAGCYYYYVDMTEIEDFSTEVLDVLFRATLMVRARGNGELVLCLSVRDSIRFLDKRYEQHLQRRAEINDPKWEPVWNPSEEINVFFSKDSAILYLASQCILRNRSQHQVHDVVSVNTLEIHPVPAVPTPEIVVQGSKFATLR